MNTLKSLTPFHRASSFPLLFIVLVSVNLSYAANSIYHNQSLSGTQKLTSENGNFVLGFFRPGNSSYYYVGIWYNLNKVSQFTSVWVANRETPITDPTTAELKISDDGNLVLSNQSNPQIWSTNTTLTSNSTVIVLLDSGNLVLRESSNPNITLWQSFDHQTDTWLPGARVGLNKVTGNFQRLISWKNIDDPAPGIFSLEMDPAGISQFLMLWNNSYRYWISGTWNEKIFTSVPEMTAYSVDPNMSAYSFQYVSNAKENYFTYAIAGDIFSRFIVDVSGQITQRTWVDYSKEWLLFWTEPKQQCQVHALCGPFGSCNEKALPFCNCIKGFHEKSPSDWDLSDRTGGCVRNAPLQCGKNSLIGAEKDGFYTLSNVRMPDNAQSIPVLSASDCKLGCLNNCSCTAYSYNSSGCSVWYGDLLNLQDQYSGFDGGNISIRVAASELPISESKKGVLIKAVVGGVAGSSVLLAMVWLLIWHWRKRSGVSGKLKTVEGGLVTFRYGDLQRMTKKFSEKLGGGGFGSVFKGVLPDSTEIAVKRLEGLRQGEKQFRTEVRTIGIVQHVNLVRLRGYCSEGDHKLLVYEYMPNGSLDTQLFLNNDSGKALRWQMRYQIALGTAQGLAYLHEQCRDSIIHCDIKPENILLDASFVPKIADFGLAKLIGREFSRVLTTMRGTLGYLAPEWIAGVAITAKADVYSYGMMLFEIISGKRNTKQTEDDDELEFFPTLAAGKLIEGDIISLLDCRLEGDANLEEVVRACKVACWCIQDDEDSRPSMGQVVQILEGVLEVNVPPVPRSLQALADKPGSLAFYSELSLDRSLQ